jgi:hypothetical protein
MSGKYKGYHGKQKLVFVTGRMKIGIIDLYKKLKLSCSASPSFYSTSLQQLLPKD